VPVRPKRLAYCDDARLFAEVGPVIDGVIAHVYVSKVKSDIHHGHSRYTQFGIGLAFDHRLKLVDVIFPFSGGDVLEAEYIRDGVHPRTQLRQVGQNSLVAQPHVPAILQFYAVLHIVLVADLDQALDAHARKPRESFHRVEVNAEHQCCLLFGMSPSLGDSRSVVAFALLRPA